MKFSIQIRCMKPEALHRATSLANCQFKHGAATRTQQSRSAHLRYHAGCLAWLQLFKAARILAILVTEGKVVEQVLGLLNAPEGEHLRDAWTNAAHIRHRS